MANSAVQYSLLVFEIVFYNCCNIMGVACKGLSGWEGVVGLGGQAKGGPFLLLGYKTVIPCSQQATGMCTNHKIG